MKRVMVFFLLILTPSLCWGQASPDSSNQEPLRLNNQHEQQRDVFGRPTITDSVFSGNYGTSATRHAIPVDFEDIKGFHLIFGLKEEYSSNLNLTQDNRMDDFITTVSSGFRYNKQDPGAGLDLMYVLGYNIYAKNSGLDYLGHLAGLNSFYRPNPNWTFILRNYLIRNDDPLEVDPSNPGLYTLSTPDQRAAYIRNIAEPQIEYRFGPENYLGLLYRNMYFNSDNADVSDGTEQNLNPRLMYWFNVHNGILIDYSYRWTEMKQSPDWTGNDMRGRYIYRFSPITSVFAEYYFGNRIFDPPSVDYKIYSPSAGIQHSFSPSLLLLLQVGYLEMSPDSGNNHLSPVLNIAMTKRTELSTYSLSIIRGFREDYVPPENLGYAEYQRLEASFSQRLLQRLTMLLTGAIEKAEFTRNDIDQDIYSLTAGISWNPLKGLFIIPALSYRNADSNSAESTYVELRGMLKITWFY